MCQRLCGVFFSPACVFLVRLGLAWLGLLAPAAVVHESLWSGWVGWGWVEVAGLAVLGDTAVHLPGRTLGASHTPDDLIVLEVFFLFM